MKQVYLFVLEPGDLFAKGPGKTAELGKVLAQGIAHTDYEDEYGHLQSMPNRFIVWVDA